VEPKRLYRSVKNRVLCGVCGGIGEYFQVDPVMGSSDVSTVVAPFVPFVHGIFPGGRKPGSLHHRCGHHTPGAKG